MNYECTFGFLLSPNTVTGGRADPAMVLLRQILVQYFYTFREDDGACLLIGIPEGRKKELAERVGKWIEAAKRENNFASLPAISLEIVGDEKGSSAAFTGRCDLMVGAEHGSAERLFDAYRSCVGDNAIDKFEKEFVVDLYDMNKVMEDRRCGVRKWGSTDLTQAHPYLDYVSEKGSALESLLDVGCGAGAIHDLIRRYCRRKGISFPSYTGIDYSRSQIFRARKNYPNGVFHLGSSAKLPYPDRSFGIVLAHSMLPFIPLDGQLSAIGELLRVSRDGAFFGLACRVSNVDLPIPEVQDYRILTHPEDARTVLHYYSELDSVRDIVNAGGDSVLLAEHQFMLIGQNKKALYISEKTQGEKHAYLKQVAADMRNKIDAGEAAEDQVIETSGLGPARLFEYAEVQVYPKTWFEARFDKVDTEVDNYGYFE